MVVFTAAITKCKHSDREVRRYVCDGGAIQLREQCLKCGAATSGAIKRFAGWESLPAFDFELQRTVHCEIKEAEIDINRERSAQFWAIYNEYLLSEEWEKRRQLVFKRANGICEGCLENKAVLVHHMTYSHVYNELCYELVALCQECHDFAHSNYDWRKIAFGGDVEL